MSIKVLVAATNPTRDSLLVVLRSMNEVKVVDTAADMDLALMMMREIRPSLILLDAGLAEGVFDLIRNIKLENPLTKSIVLVDRAEQQRLAVEAGASGVLLKGFSFAQLKEMMAKLYPEQFEVIAK